MKYFIRWRKASATWVIYKGRHEIFESGFDTAEGARSYLLDHVPDANVTIEPWRKILKP